MEQVIESFKYALNELGLIPDEVIVGKKFVKCPIIDGGPTDGRYWLVLDDFPNGYMKNWKTGEERRWRGGVEFKSLSPEQKQKYLDKKKQQEQELDRERKTAAELASKIWSESVALSDQFLYFAKKGLKPVGLRYFRETNEAIIPIFNDKNKIITIQKISPDGTKTFLTGGQTEGGYFVIPGDSSKYIFCEGYATGLSIKIAMPDDNVVVAFNAGNLEKVAKQFRKKLPENHFIIAADNDQWGKQNAGLKFGTRAAEATGANLIYPVFNSPLGNPTDFDDLRQREGVPRVAEMIESCIQLQQVVSPQPDPLIKDDVDSVEEAIVSIDPITKDTKDSEIAIKISKLIKKFTMVDKFGTAYNFNGVCWSKIEPDQFGAMICSIMDNACIDGYKAAVASGVSKLIKMKLIRQTHWNTDPDLLPMRNGVLNLKTKKLEQISPENMFNWFIPHDYNPDAVCPEFDSLIEWLADGNTDTKEILLCFLAAILKGRSDTQKYLEIIGMPGTGKSSYLTVASALVGKQNVHSTTMRALNERFETGKFFNKKLAIFADAKSYMEGVDVFKSIVGQDPIPNEQKFEKERDPFVFQGMVIVAANSYISFDDSSTAMARRRITVEINKMLDKSRMKENFYKILESEIPGIINQVISIDDKKIYEVLTKEQTNKTNILIETNSVAEWINENLVFDPIGKVYIGLAYRSSDGTYLNSDEKIYPNYIQYCEGVGMRGGYKQRKFIATVKEILKTKGIPYGSGEDRVGCFFTGIRLRKFQDMAPKPLSLA